MSSKKAPKKPVKRRFSQEDLDEALEMGTKRGEKLGYRAGFRQAKLEAFAICARAGTAFTVHPGVSEFVLPLVEKALLDCDGDTKRAEWSVAR